MTRLPLSKVSSDVAARIEEIMRLHEDPTGKLLDALNSVQDAFGYVPSEAMEKIAEEMGTPLAQIEQMSDFFAYLSREPLGACVIDVCDGTACHVRGAARLLAEFEKRLGISVGQTTPDGRFTLRSVDCVGACGLAPVVVAGEEAYGRVKITNVADLIKTASDAIVVDADTSQLDGAGSGCKAGIRGASENEEGADSRLGDAAGCDLRLDDVAGRNLAACLADSNGEPLTLRDVPPTHFVATADAHARVIELRRCGMRSLLPDVARVSVGMGTCGRAAGAQDVFDILSAKLVGHAHVVEVGCRGLCSFEPLVEVTLPDGQSHLFHTVDRQRAEKVAAFALGECDVQDVTAFRLDPCTFGAQERRIMSNCGIVDPRSLEEYVARGGFSALMSVLDASSPDAVIATVEEAGLRGRGGAGFPTGRKWRACAASEDPVKYFIVNADEGDPGAYMDRGLLESDPYRVLEGLAIGCFAVGARKAYVFVRAEYALAVETLRHAIAQAEAAGLLGRDIAGSGFSLEVEVIRGAGAFVCGESTAMVSVLENGPCKARKKPPHLTEIGLWGHPTCLNNVETLANVALLVDKGAAWFRSVGTSESPGTKVFSVTGSQVSTGLVEVSLGIRLGEMLSDLAQAREPKAVQIGGPSGGIVPADWEDLEISFEGLDHAGAMMGSGGFVVIEKDECVVETARYLASFAARQSCGQCRSCREDARACADILREITEGRGTPEDLDELRRLCGELRRGSLCGLGKSAANPLDTSLRYFEEEYRAHLTGCCPGLSCERLVSYVIEAEKCQGERCCLNTCPGNAIKGPFGKPGRIVGRLCQKCGMCVVYCPYGAVKKVSPAV